MLDHDRGRPRPQRSFSVGVPSGSLPPGQAPGRANGGGPPIMLYCTFATCQRSPGLTNTCVTRNCPSVRWPAKVAFWVTVAMVIAALP